MPLIRPFLLAPLALAAGLAAAPAGAAGLTTVCAPEIARYCSDVSSGRGRVSACLASRAGELSSACRASVQALARNPLTPAWVRPVFDPGTKVTLPQACAAPAARYCSGMAPSGGAVFACLYGYSDRVPASCTNAAEATLKQAR